MNLLFHIVYAAHATGTHHKLALDALRHLKCMDADMWQRLFLQHAKLYLEGSKAPDNEFKDFKNHVLHTRDGYWGGAPEKVRSWYHHLVEALAQEDWPTAVYCAGVLSHYYTDPLQPFHTAQSEAENNIHRAVEWSISKAYDELRALGEVEFANMDVELPPGPNWLAQLRLPGRREGQRLLREADRPLRHPARRRRSAGRPRSRGAAHRRRADPLRGAQLCRRARPRHRRGQRARRPSVSLAAATLAAVAQVPFKVIARRIADTGGAPPRRAHVRRAARHRHGRDAPGRGRPRRCATCTRRRCWPSVRRSPRRPRCFPSGRASRSSRAQRARRQARAPAASTSGSQMWCRRCAPRPPPSVGRGQPRNVVAAPGASLRPKAGLTERLRAA